MTEIGAAPRIVTEQDLRLYCDHVFVFQPGMVVVVPRSREHLDALLERRPIGLYLLAYDSLERYWGSLNAQIAAVEERTRVKYPSSYGEKR